MNFKVVINLLDANLEWGLYKTLNRWIPFAITLPQAIFVSCSRRPRRSWSSMFRLQHISKTNAPPLIIRLLTTTSWHPPPASGSCRRGRRLPAADVGRHQLVFSGQACCPWSAASPSHSRCLGKCSAVETWVENEESSHPAGDGESDSRVSYVSVPGFILVHLSLSFPFSLFLGL